jgi:hypothetical protein
LRRSSGAIHLKELNILNHKTLWVIDRTLYLRGSQIGGLSTERLQSLLTLFGLSDWRGCLHIWDLYVRLLGCVSILIHREFEYWIFGLVLHWISQTTSAYLINYHLI